MKMTGQSWESWMSEMMRIVLVVQGSQGGKKVSVGWEIAVEVGRRYRNLKNLQHSLDFY